MEIIITLLIVAVAVFIIAKKFKTSSDGKCHCDGCTKNCQARGTDDCSIKISK